MATTVTYTANLRTRKDSSTGNSKSSAASQEYYEPGYNYVGIINFSGMSLTNKVITGISLRTVSARAGWGVGDPKTIYFRKSNYQAASKTGVTGAQYCGAALGTISGIYFGNTQTQSITGSLLTNLAQYISAGNNTLCIYNPSPTRSSQGYSNNYMQWDDVRITVTYEEPASIPTTSAGTSTVDMGAQITIYTNRVSTSATHTLECTFSNNPTVMPIATGVGASYVWTTPIDAFATKIPSKDNDVCTITCKTYYGTTLTGTKTCQVRLHVPNSVLPTMPTLTYTEAVSGIAAKFGAFVQNKSKLNVSASASGAKGSTISSWSATVNGQTFSTNSFTTGVLTGNTTLTIAAKDSRNRTVKRTATISVVAYSPPSMPTFKAARGTGNNETKVYVNIAGSVSPVNNLNNKVCNIYWKLANGSTWNLDRSVPFSGYGVSQTNLQLNGTYNVLNSYQFKAELSDYFTSSAPVAQFANVSTTQVIMDLRSDGSGIAFGKIAESSNVADFKWKVKAPNINGGTYTSVTQLGLAIGSATVNACYTVMPDGSILIARSQDFAAAEAPVSGMLGTFEICKAEGARAYAVFYGKTATAGDGTHRKYLNNAGNAFESDWHRGIECGTDIPESANLNNYKTVGIFCCPMTATAQTLSNCPATEAFTMVILPNAGVTQILITYSASNPRMFLRNYYGYEQTWSTWRQDFGLAANLAAAQSSLGFGVSETTSPAVTPTAGTLDYFRLYKVGRLVTLSMHYSTGLALGVTDEAAIIPAAYRSADPAIALETNFGNNTIITKAYLKPDGTIRIRASANISDLIVSGSWVTP